MDQCKVGLEVVFTGIDTDQQSKRFLFGNETESKSESKSSGKSATVGHDKGKAILKGAVKGAIKGALWDFTTGGPAGVLPGAVAGAKSGAAIAAVKGSVTEAAKGVAVTGAAKSSSLFHQKVKLHILCYNKEKIKTMIKISTLYVYI